MASDKARSVLIVEDERIVAMDLQQTLDDMGYDAFAIASSADEALSRVAERCPDLILMDIRIKGNRDGIETATLLRERFDIPVVYLTAYADEATLARAKATGPYGYLLKPVKPAELRSAIEVSLFRHTLERRLRERERWFSTTLHSIADAVITVDLAGHITFMNPSAERLVGIAAANAIGHPAREIMHLEHPESLARIESPLDAVLNDRRTSLLSEATLIAGDNTRRLIGDSASPVTSDGQLLGAVMVFRDITEEKLLRRQLELSDRLTSLGTMAAGVAHEVNNPLTVVISNASAVASEVAAVQTALRALNLDATSALADRLADAVQAQSELAVAARRIGGIVADLKAFSRPPEHGAGEADVTRALEWAIRTTAHELRHRTRLVATIPTLPLARGDETRLGQVFINLLLNAAQAIAPGDVEHNEVAVTARVDGERIVVEFRDTGPGIAPDVRAHIFEPFFTTKEVGKGVGLGLSICHGIITSMQGEITVASELGKGATFRVALPLAPSKSAPPAPAPVPAARRHGKILVIDDEPLMHQVLKRLLREHEVTCLDNAHDALALIERGERFDVVLSDVTMPTMTGIQFYEELLAHHPDVARRIVFVTGGAITAAVEAFLQTVPNTVLMKPFGVDEIEAVIAKLIES